MFKEAKPDGVIIVTPNHLHLPVARQALAHGVVPLVEKPISDDLDDALRFAEEAEKAGIPVLVGQHRRHNPKVNKGQRNYCFGSFGDAHSFVVPLPDLQE
ncbi:Gfo/Idh/MocA family protein [Actinobaculum suis]|uniref:Gfo/Idh/MocA family protein n=1 Tax=Actinobaculum suis TaxID=1657 RepID=UPI000A9AF337|nr:Gfo/Idh/MocA family oxidoreductase [Actinobaculum suis]